MINGLYTPLNLNCLGDLLQNQGLGINSNQLALIGTSTSNTTYTTRGSIYTDTLILNKLADVTSLAYTKIGGSPGITSGTYNSLINMGSSTVPALGNSKPNTFTNTYTGEMTKYGWLRLIAYQAYQEFNVNGSTNYSDFLSTFLTCDSYLKQTNQLIKNYNQSNSFLTATYSNINDLITSDITGVSLSTLYWGQDLVASGRAIDLTRISEFGLPSILLSTLSKNRALTPSLSVALLSAGFTGTDIDNMLAGNVTVAQEKLLYSSFALIVEKDLADICTLLNCQTFGLNSLIDLLDPKKLFPNSYKTLTFPNFNSDVLPTNSKTYYPIYINDNPDIGLTPTIGFRLISILPRSIACACDAFSISMMQISNVQTMNIEKFAQVVVNLENLSDLNVETGSSPINRPTAVSALNVLAKGSNSDGSYNTCDFFGAITNIHYDLASLKGLIKMMDTSALYTIYNNMYTLLSGGGPYETTLLNYITDANNAINNILTSNPVACDSINTLYNTFGTYLTKEQNARTEALPGLVDLTTSTRDIYSFMNTLNEFALETQDKGPCLVLESIANLSTIGGTSLIGSMREVRNSARLGLTGGRLDSGVSNQQFTLPRVTLSTSSQNGVPGYTPNGLISNIPIVTGAAIVPGSLAGSPEVSLIPNNLNLFNINVKNSVLTPSEAVDEVIRCNCDCWDNL